MSNLISIIVIFGVGFIIGGATGIKWGYDQAIQQLDKILKKIESE